MKLLPVVLLSGLLTLSACASQPVTYYRLPDSSFQLPPQQHQLVQLQVMLADSLNQGSLIYQSGANTLYPATQHQWADDLSHEISATLANDLNRISTAYGYTILPDSKRQLTIHIDTFQGSYDGYIRISGYTEWQNQPELNRNFNVRVAQQGDGYNNMVNALAQGLQQVAQQIAP